MQAKIYKLYLLLKIVSFQEDEMLFVQGKDTGENGQHKQISKQQVLERFWRKGNPSTLLVGMQTGAVTVKNNIEFPQKTKNGTAF